MTDAELHQRIDGLLTRVTSVRSHFIGLLCFLSIWMLSAPLWKAALIGCLASCSMIFHVQDRAVTVLVFALTVVSLAVFLGVSLGDVKQTAADLRALY